MKRIILLGVLFLTACQTTPTDNPNLEVIGQIHADLLDKFTPVSQSAVSDVYVNHSGEEDFTGDCDDFLAAAKNQLIKYGFTPVAVTGYSRAGTFHVFVCAEEDAMLCLDPNYFSPHSLRRLRGVYREITMYRYPIEDVRRIAAELRDFEVARD